MIRLYCTQGPKGMKNIINIIVMFSLFSSIAYAQDTHQNKADNRPLTTIKQLSNGGNGGFSVVRVEYNTDIYHAEDVDVSDFFNKKPESDFKGSKWVYKKRYDEVEKTYSTLSTITSTNAVNLGIGQGGNQNLFITILNEHDTGFYNDSIIIGHNAGLVGVCSDSCHVRARFDDDDARWYQLNYLTPNTYTVAKTENYPDAKRLGNTKLKEDDYFLLKLYNSKSLVINFPNFDGNTYTYRFNLKGLDSKKMGSK